MRVSARLQLRRKQIARLRLGDPPPARKRRSTVARRGQTAPMLALSLVVASARVGRCAADSDLVRMRLIESRLRVDINICTNLIQVSMMPCQLFVERARRGD